MLELPKNYSPRLADRFDRRGKLCSAIILIPTDGDTKGRLTWTTCRGPDHGPTGSQLAEVMHAIEQRRGVGLFFPNFRDGVKFFQKLLEAREARMGAAA